MKKREWKKHNDKIILFPDLEKRLLDKGLESLQQKKFSQAIDLFEKALEINPENDEVHIGLVLAYFESGALEKAKEFSNNMLQAGIGDYFQVIDLYLMILVQLNQYEEIAVTIGILLEEREIPKEKFEHFTRMLEFSRRMAESKMEDQSGREYQPEVEEKNLNLFSNQNETDQLLIIAQLAERNIRPYIDEIKAYLQSKEGKPFFKTMLLNVLSEHEYDKEVMIEKLDKEKSVIPSQLPEVKQQPLLQKILMHLRDHLENSDPILYENTKMTIERHFFLIYPFTLEPEDEAIWAAAYHSMANQYFGIPDSSTDLAESYNVKEEEISQAVISIREIEEISYPNI